MTTKRSFWSSLVWTASGDMDLGWLLTLIFGLIGALGFLVDMFTGHHISLAAWSWLAGSFLAVLITAVPIAKARLLANSRALGDVTKGMASIMEDPGVSSDVSELYQRKYGTTPPTHDTDIG